MSFTHNEVLRIGEESVDFLQAGHDLVHILLLHRETSLRMLHVLVSVLTAGRFLGRVLLLHRGQRVEDTERHQGPCRKWLVGAICSPLAG